MSADYTFYEFFSGGGMARLGLGSHWRCLFANDWCKKKAAAYRVNFGNTGHFSSADVRKISITDLPGKPDLVWGSFPCQDLSLAGAGAGLEGERSGVFWPFLRLTNGLNRKGRGPSILVLENVVGALTSHDGLDFLAILKALSQGGFRFGAVVINSEYFVPQSRPRLFIVAVSEDIKIPGNLLSSAPMTPWHTPSLRQAYARIPARIRESWLWWNVPVPAPRQSELADLLEPDNSINLNWHQPVETRKLLSLMSPLNSEKVRVAKKKKARVVGCIYKRTRSENGVKVQRAEVRFDGLSGCLRTPGGGSSRQIIIVVNGDSVRSRLLSAREAARLMGLPDSYVLPGKYNDAYHLAGDGVAVPVVSWLEFHLFRKVMAGRMKTTVEIDTILRAANKTGMAVNA
jgi:DNA (cytosine-5)-methyltransferase 1